MKPRRTILRWSPPGSAAPPSDERSLAERLQAVASDRIGSADEVVRDAAREAAAWLRPRAAGECSRAALAAELRQGLVAWEAAHVWRALCARFLGRLTARLEARAATAEALLAFLDEEARAAVPERRSIVPFALRSLGRGERVLVLGHSETVALALEEAARAGLAPEVLLGEGRPELTGKRLARRLARRGLDLRMTYDAALPEEVAGVDRIWLGTEALDARAFVGRVGDRALFGAAREQGVPVELLATRDKLHPAGRIELPAWSEREPHLLWGDAPAGVTLEARFLARIELDHVDAWIHERGRCAGPARAASGHHARLSRELEHERTDLHATP